MDPKEFTRLCASIEEAGQIQRGEKKASRTYESNGDSDYICIGSQEMSNILDREVRLVVKRKRPLLGRLWNMIRRS